MALIDSSYTHRDGETRGINYRRWVIAQATLTACLKVKGMRWVVWSCWIYAFLQGIFFLPESELNDHFSDAAPHLKKLNFIATEAGLNLAELSLLWLISQQEVSKVVIGVDNVDQLSNHIHTLSKSVEPAVFVEAMTVQYDNETILNPSLWP